MPSPTRRSARGAPPLTKPPPPTSISSSSSLSSARQERKIRITGQLKSTTPHSRSSEETSEAPRRRQRPQPAKDPEPEPDERDVEEAIIDEEEVTRCLCGQQEYPGPPLSEAFSGTDEPSDDAGGLFIQCDGCSVWQHGGCVGIMEESQSPDKYFCEECKPKLHELHTDSRGQKYSLYGPVQPKTSRKPSISKNDEKAKKEREAATPRTSADPSTGRRRATMRSKEHDDEEEQLRRALEESKRDAVVPTNGRRNGKRARDDSDEIKQEIKRQRTASESITSTVRTASFDDESDEDLAPVSKAKRARAEAVQSAREAELRDKEIERERARADAAGRRQERAGRRRADDPEAAGDTPQPGVSARPSPPPSSQPPTPPAFAAPEKVSHKKGAGKKTKKLGNNQYTKARELSNQPPTSSPHSKKRQLANQGNSSGDEVVVNGETHTSNSTNKHSPGGQEGTNGKPGKFGKGKNKPVNGASKLDEPAERTMANMKRGVDNMMAFVQKQQLDMFGGGTPPGTDPSVPRVNVENASLMIMARGAVQPPGSSVGAEERSFEELSPTEQADALSGEIREWNRRFAHLA